MPRKQLGKAAVASNDLMTRADVLALAGRHAKFTGTLTTALSISLGATQTVTLNVSPIVTGDSLVAGEDISVQPTAAIPGGINLAWWYVSGTNQVALGFTSSALISLPSPSIPFRVTAHR